MKRITADILIDTVQAARVAEAIRAAITAELSEAERDAIAELAKSVQTARTIEAAISFGADGDDLSPVDCGGLAAMVLSDLRDEGLASPVMRFEGAYLFGVKP